jgi:hypothetical protein
MFAWEVRGWPTETAIGRRFDTFGAMSSRERAERFERFASGIHHYLLSLAKLGAWGFAYGVVLAYLTHRRKWRDQRAELMKLVTEAGDNLGRAVVEAKALQVENARAADATSRLTRMIVVLTAVNVVLVAATVLVAVLAPPS